MQLSELITFSDELISIPQPTNRQRTNTRCQYRSNNNDHPPKCMDNGLPMKRLFTAVNLNDNEFLGNSFRQVKETVPYSDLSYKRNELNKGDANHQKHFLLPATRHLNSQIGKSLQIVTLSPISIDSQILKPQVINLRQTFNLPTGATKCNSFLSESSTQTSTTLIQMFVGKYEGRENGLQNKKILPQNDGKRRSDDKLKTNIPRKAPPNFGRMSPKKNTQKPKQTIMSPVYRCRSRKCPGYMGRPICRIHKNFRNRRLCADQSSDVITSGCDGEEEIMHHDKETKMDDISYVKRPLDSSNLNNSKTLHGMFSGRFTDWEEDLSTSVDSKTITHGSKETLEKLETVAPFENEIINNRLESIMERLQDFSWEKSLDAVCELKEIIPLVDWKKNVKNISIINRKLIDFCRSPRSTLCRVSCQAVSDMFRYVQNTKRPEFDDIVYLLLCKTADPNRFIQKDANIALDKMVTYMPVFHSVRVLSAFGPTHKNPLVRIATARLLVCVVALAGLENIIGIDANPRTRKRVLTSLGRFLIDKNYDTRKFGERLCRILRKHKYFNEYFYKDLENAKRNELRRVVNAIPSS